MTRDPVFSELMSEGVGCQGVGLFCLAIIVSVVFQADWSPALRPRFRYLEATRFGKAARGTSLDVCNHG
jgi:hypothetical protein